MNINEILHEIADQRGEIAEATQNARTSIAKLDTLLLKDLGDAPWNNIPKSAEQKLFLYNLLVAYAQGSDSLQIFAEEENLPYEEITRGITRVIQYLELPGII